MSLDLEAYNTTTHAASNDDLARARLEERKRVAGILDHPNAKGREAIARKLAFTTAMTVEDAGGFLADIPTANNSSIGARAAETVTTASIDTGELNSTGARAGAVEADRAPAQNGAVPWSQIAAEMNRWK